MLVSLIKKLNLQLIAANLVFSFGVLSPNAIFAQTENQDELQEESTPAIVDERAEVENKNTVQEKSEPEKPESDGQADLDKAFDLKITASSTRDLDKVADLCESAIEGGLDEESEEQANELWASVLLDHAKQLNRRIAPRGTLSTRWRWLRKQAITRLEKAIEIRPAKIDALILLARLHSLNAGDQEAALEAIEKAISQISNDNRKLSEALFVRARLAEDDEARIDDLTQAVKIDPQNVDALKERAMFHLQAEETELAMKDFRNVLATDDKNSDLYILISQELRRRQLFSESAEILDLAIGKNELNDDLYVLRGQAFLAAEDDDAALKDLNKALEINRQNIEALSLRARAYLVKEEYDKALADANELIQQQPESDAGLAMRSLIYRSNDNLEKAIEDVEALLEKKPENLDYQFDLAILLNADEKPNKAIPIFDTIISRIPDAAQSQILRNRGDAYLSLGKHERAIDDYELALELMEENEDSLVDGMSSDREDRVKSGLLNNLAWVLATSPKDDVRNGKRAIELATKAAEMTDFKAAFILSTLASSYAEEGDFVTARKWATKAVELAESDEQRIGLQEELDSYKADKAWRENENVEEKDGNNEDGQPAEDSDSSDSSPDDNGTESDDSNEQTLTKTWPSLATC